MNIIIFGPPGAGKGTQSKFIEKKYNLLQLSTGELLRNEIKNKTQLGLEISSIINSGDLVSDDIVSKLIEKYISDKKNKQRLIFDGYPRNIDQAKNLDKLLKKYNQSIDIVLKLSVSLETVKKRISERKTQEKRADDSEAIAIKRYQNYEKSSKPVIDFYNEIVLLYGVISPDLCTKESCPIMNAGRKFTYVTSTSHHSTSHHITRQTFTDICGPTEKNTKHRRKCQPLNIFIVSWNGWIDKSVMNVSYRRMVFRIERILKSSSKSFSDKQPFN